MSRIEKHITVDAPIDTVYGQWTQFESFPTFMEGVDKVVQVDDRTLDWTASVAGRTKTWQARITDQTPTERIAWKSIDGAQNDGAVMFLPTSPGQTEIRLVVDADPDGIGRAGRRQARVPRSPHRWRPRPLQGLHRRPQRAHRRMAGRDPR